MPTYKLTLEYDGTDYAGWQRQPDQPTIQQNVEEALSRLTQETITVIAAGRTDAGVHAFGQVVSFRAATRRNSKEWLRALNGLLPHDIGSKDIEEVPDVFHARYHAITKHYEYRICNSPEKAVLDRLRVWHIPKLLNVSLMRQGASCLMGQHDFSSFENSPTDNKNPICTIQNLNSIQNGSHILIQISADRFLKQMVRSIVGTLVEVGHQKRLPIHMKEILEMKDRRAAGKTAPPHGLFLMSVDYTDKMSKVKSKNDHKSVEN